MMCFGTSIFESIVIIVACQPRLFELVWVFSGYDILFVQAHWVFKSLDEDSNGNMNRLWILRLGLRGFI
jgi:hypothetical protein